MEAVFSDFNYESVCSHQVEEWGPFLSSLRIFYQSGLEIEYGVSTTDWIRAPLDSGTKEVVKEGFRILLDKDQYFREIIQFLEE
jgi:hypothetical protein